MHLHKEGWIEAYRQKDALWIHDGNPKRPHALLASGNHSSGFFNSRLVIPDGALLQEAASDLLELFVQSGESLDAIQFVVGPQTGATRLSEFMGEHITAITGEDCYSASPAKDEVDGVKSMVFEIRDSRLLRNRLVLLCEDVLTTGGSVGLAADAVTAAGGVVMPFILVLVNRSGLKEVNGKRIIALIDHPMPTWAPDECPLCKAGSEAVRPKDNWSALNADY